MLRDAVAVTPLPPLSNPRCRWRPFSGALALVVLAMLPAASCGRAERFVTVYSSVDPAVAEPVFRAFEAQTGIRVRAVYDAEDERGAGLVNRLLAEADRPHADVFWSGDAIRPGLLERRAVVDAAALPEQDPLVPETAGLVLAHTRNVPVAARVRVLLVNLERLAARAPPESVRDLSEARFRGDAAIGCPCLGAMAVHVAAIAARLGDDGAHAFLEELRANDVRFATSDDEVKRLVMRGEVAVGLMDSDAAAAALDAGAPVRIVVPDQDGAEAVGALVLPTAAVRIAHGPDPRAGTDLLGFLGRASTEALLTGDGGHLPLRAGAKDAPRAAGLPPLASIRVMRLDPDLVAVALARIEPWLRDWAGP